MPKVEVLIYKHACAECGRVWNSVKKIDYCPRCGHAHIWFNGSSFIDEMEIKNVKDE